MIDVHKLILILIMGVFQTYILWRLIRKVFYKKPLGMKGYAVLIFFCILDIIIVTIMEVFSIFQFSESGIFVCLVCFELELIVETIDCRHGKWKKNDEWYVLCLIPLVTGGIWACLNKQFILADDIKAMIIMIVVWLNVFIFYFLFLRNDAGILSGSSGKSSDHISEEDLRNANGTCGKDGKTDVSFST